jgi:hypothetical protein
MSSDYGQQSRILKEIFETAKGFYNAGTMDHETFQEFEKLCKQPAEPKKKNDRK